MKKLIIFLWFPLSLGATITDVQHPAAATGSANTCAVTITANGTGATHLLIYKVAMAAGNTLSSVAGGGTWTVCGNCNASDASAGETGIGYLNAPTSSVTTITGTIASSGSGAVCWVEEYSTNQSAFTLETTSSSNNKVDASCTSCAAPTLTITGTNDVITSISSCGNTCSGTITNWSTLYTSGDGSARRINTTSSAFNWAQSPASTLATGSIAFMDASGATVKRLRGSVTQSP